MVRHRSLPVVLTVFGVVGALAALARIPDEPAAEVERLAAHFRFDWQTLPPVPMPPGGVVFPINKTAAHMPFYIYQIGASAALGDLDGDGLPNDLCITDPRAKGAEVRPVPGTGNRYATFTLDFGPYFDRTTQHPTVCRIADMNEDGLADLFVAFYGRPPLLLLRRAPLDVGSRPPLDAAAFAVRELVPGLEQTWWTATSAFADVDGDGHQDVVVGNYYPDGAEITDASSSKPFEMNRDFSRARNGGKNRIFLHAGGSSGPEPTATFRDAGDVFPGDDAFAWTLAVGAGDIDRDGLSDLYIANDFGPDELYWNRSTPGKVNLVALHGKRGFFTPESMALGRDSFKGMSIDFGDVNGDGTFDMFVSNIGSPFALQEGHFLWESTGDVGEMKEGVAPYVDRSDEAGVAHSAWAWDARFEDFDNDSVLELVQATGLVKGTANRWPDLAQVGAANDNLVRYQSSWPKFMVGSDVDGYYPEPFWALAKDGRYADLSGTLFPGLTVACRGIAVGDVEGDGYPEMVYANYWEDSVYVKNESAGNRFLALHLLLPVGASAAGGPPRVHDGHPAWREGTPAIGAFVEADVPGGKAQIRQVDGGNGHSGQRSPEVRFGLGKTAPAAIPVKITWRGLDGALHHDALALAPGYHTVVLGGQGATL